MASAETLHDGWPVTVPGSWLLPSRAGIRSNAAKDFVGELEMQGVYVATPEVDIGDLTIVAHFFDDLAKSMA